MYLSASGLRGGFAAALLVFTSSLCFAQRDPGVRQGPPGAGDHLPGLTLEERKLFREGTQRVIQLEAVCDDCNDRTLGSFTSIRVRRIS